MQFYSIRTPEQVALALHELGSARPLRRLLHLARSQGAATAVAEEGVTCEGWDEEMGLFYHSVPDSLEGVSVKVTFVKSAVSSEEEFAALKLEDESIGYAIIRPTPLGTIAESKIIPPYRSDHHYLVCGPQDGVGPLSSAIAFMQQDVTVTRCAHASIWITTSALHERFPDSPVVGAKVIHDVLATSNPGTPRIPSRGLHQVQIAQALSESGYRVVNYDFESARDERGEAREADRIVYRYVESGIPVILGIDTQIGRHTVVLLGHGFDADAWWPGAGPGYYPTLAGGGSWLPSSFWATDYIIHDDNFGPYLNLSRGSVRIRGVAAIVAIPNCLNMMMLPEEAEPKAMSALSVVLREAYDPVVTGAYPGGLTNEAARVVDDVYDWAARSQLVLRTVLVSREEFAVHIAHSEYAPEVIEALLKIDREWMWMVEISSPVLFGEKLKFGEILLDPGVPPMFPGTSPLGIHLPGYVKTREGQVGVQADKISSVLHRASLAAH
jgi:hypothetical protein